MRRSGGFLSLIGVLFASMLAWSGFDAQAYTPPMPPQFRVGIESTLEPEFFVESFAPAMRTLRAAFPETRFVTKEYSSRDLSDAVARGEVDLFFADSALFGLLEHREGARPIAMRTVPGARDPGRAVSFTVVVPAESPLRTLSDLEDKRLAVESRETYSPWLLFLGRMVELGLSSDRTAENVIETGYGVADPVRALQEGLVDAAVLSSCQLERLERAGILAPKSLRVLDARGSDQDPDDPLEVDACWRSGELFPDAVFGLARQVSSSAASAITVAVLSALPTKEGYSWRVGSELTKVNDLYRKLRIGPYGYLREWSWSDLWERYRPYAFFGLLALAALLFHVFRVNLLVKRRTKELSETILEKERLDEEARDARERLSEMERAGVVSELSSMFAHEVRQPLAAATAYADGIGLGLRSGADREILCEAAENLSRETKRISDIVERVRSYAKSGGRKHERIDVARLVERAKTLFEHGSASVGTTVDLRVPEGLAVRGEPLELELALVNLLRNAAAAMTDRPAGERRIVIGASLSHSAEPSADAGDSRQETTKSSPSFVVLTVEDEGAAAGPIADEVFARLSEPVRSGKKEGLGLGLFIVRRIAEAHGGSLLFQRRDPPSNGLCALLRLPADGNAPRDNETATLQPTESTSKS